MCASQRSAVFEPDEQLLASLRGYLRRYAGGAAAGDDLLQETLLRAARGIDGYLGNASLKTWLFSIASRVAADHLRDPERRVHLVEISEDLEPLEPAVVLERLIVDEMNDCVRAVVDSLPPAYRSALLLHEFESMTAGEVAEVLQCSVATAKIRIHRGRERLREALSRQCDFYRDEAATFRCDRKKVR